MIQMKSNRLQNKDPVDRNRFGRGVTIKMKQCFVGPVSAAPPGVKAGGLVRSVALTPALSHREREKNGLLFA
ncbi:hypothetical protein A3461_22725 [Enterobacter roggenkampii]|nr:hypothetical protein A3461_22725 [Enterobacter roggenkampii]